MAQLSGLRTHLLVALYLATLGYQIVTGQADISPETMQEAFLAGMVSTVRAALAKLQTPV